MPMWVARFAGRVRLPIHGARDNPRYPRTKAMMIFWARERSHSWNDVCVAEARTDHAATRVPMRVGGARRLRMPGTSDKLADAMSCGPGVEADSSFSAGRCCARVHRFQHFC